MTNDILLYTLEIASASDEIKLLGGRITQQFTDYVFVAILPGISVIGKLRHSRQQPYGPLDEISQLAADAWNSFQAKLLATRDIVSPTAGLRWDTPGYQAPLKLGLSDEEPAVSPRFTGTATSLYLIGSVALGLVIVAGNTQELGFSHEEYVKVVAEVMQGLQFLVHAEPLANLSFVYNIHLLSIDAVSNKNCGDKPEFCEAIWRDPALKQLGYPTGTAGCKEYAADLKGFNNTNWSCIGFFTKYPLFHFAYARSVQICMQYDNDGWGPDNIFAVFAHEVCHIFGAADEYSDEKSQCTCDESGYLKIPNTNCVNCAASQHLPCLMETVTLNLCKWTRQQLGWSSRFFSPVLLNQISPICDNYNDLYVWGVDIYNTVYLRYRFNGQWTSWQPDWYNAPKMLSITPLRDDTDNMHVFGVKTDNTVYLNKRISAQWSGWSSWYGAPKVQSIFAFKDGANSLYVFGIGTDNSVHLNRHEGDHWSGWQHNWFNAPKMTHISAVHDRQNNLYIFGIATDHTVYLNKHERDSWSGWRNDWENAPKLISVLPVIDAGNNVYAFGVGTDYTVYVNERKDGQWSGWQLNWHNVPGMQFFGSATDNQGMLYVWGIGMDGTPYLIYRYKGTWIGWDAKWGRPTEFIDPRLYSITAVFDRNNTPHVWGLGINNNAMGNNHVEYLNWRNGEEWSGWLYQWGM